MTKTLEKKLNNLTLEQLFDVAQKLDSSFWAYEDLKNYVIDLIKDDDIFIALHILNALNDKSAEYYNYDATMGILDTVAPITSKEDFIDYLEDYNDEDIIKTIKKVL